MKVKCLTMYEVLAQFGTRRLKADWKMSEGCSFICSTERMRCRSELSEKSRLYEEAAAAAAAAAAADMTLLLGAGYRQTQRAAQRDIVFTAAGATCRHEHQPVFTDTLTESLLDAAITRSPDSCFADYYSQTDADLSD